MDMHLRIRDILDTNVQQVLMDCQWTDEVLPSCNCSRNEARR